MGQRLVAHTYSDLTPELEGETHDLRLDGVGVEVDLTDTEYAELVEYLHKYYAAGRYIENAEPPKGSPLAKRSGGQPNRRPDLTQADRNGIRSFGRLQGWKIHKNGRIPGSLIQAWEAAGSPTTAESEALLQATSQQGDLYAVPDEP